MTTTRFDDLVYVDEEGAVQICLVAMTKKVKKEFDKWDKKVRASFQEQMRTYARERNEHMIKTYFTFEARLRVKGTSTDVAICTFKQFKHRLYGSEQDGQFIITECDGAKKQDKADPDKLQRAADNLAPYIKRSTR